MVDDRTPGEPADDPVWRAWNEDLVRRAVAESAARASRSRNWQRAIVFGAGLIVLTFIVVLLVAVPSLRHSNATASLLGVAGALGALGSSWIAVINARSAEAQAALAKSRSGSVLRDTRDPTRFWWSERPRTVSPPQTTTAPPPTTPSTATGPASPPTPAPSPSPAPTSPLDRPTTDQDVREALTGRWLSPTLVIPAVGVILAAVIAASVSVIGLYKSQSPASIDCVTERSAAATLFDKHPEDELPYTASSQLEKQCQINEFVAKLKTAQ